jgi:amino-acid N-acetyltransferase
MNDSAPQPALDSATAAATTSGSSAVPHAQFVTWLRDVAPYVHAHRGKTFVVGVGGELIAAGRLTALVQDVSLLYAMGIRVVLVYGSRPQVQEQLRLKGLTSSFGQGVRITDPAALECVKEAAGEIRLDIEAAFSQGLPNTPMANSKVRVISGNFITARPMGIIDGVDFQHTGVVRKVDAEALRFTLANNALVLISPLGFSPTGEAFNLTFEDVATSVASALKAEKLILLAEEDGVRTVDGELKTEITVPEAERLIEAKQIDQAGLDELRFLLRACNTGVKRGHLLPFGLDGSLLVELFTRDGVGTMVASENLEALREATLDDVGGLIKLLEPLEADGTLVKRPRELIEREIDHFTVLEHDGFIFGCAALYPFPQAKMGELACLTVHSQYREYGDGERLMKRIEVRARAAGLSKLFVLTTRTAHWFLKRGFSIANVEHLPIERQQLYNWQRRSQVLVKTL